MAERSCLIVGGCGYIGSRLAEALAAEYAVTVTRRQRSPLRDAWIARSGVTVMDFDSGRDPPLNPQGDFDAVIHLAMPGAAEAARDPDAARKASISVGGSLQLLQNGRAGRLLHFSSFHVYGGAGRARFDESDPAAPVHPYGAIHWDCERLLSTHPAVTIIRPSNIVACPAHADLGDQSRLLFLDICRQAAGGAIALNNDGLSFRDFVAFDDLLSAVRLLLDREPDGHRLFNVAQGAARRLDEIAGMVGSAAEPAVPVQLGDGRDAFRAPFEISIERLAALGWRPAAGLVDETRRIIRFFS